ncbi:MAG: sigma-54 dependent transcriptional regulator [Bryobacteraceae bacterium]|nr:sigma-54 dependent transcriptional regulator [Bryobacteraceae bacterium]MCX7603229.1 sigma-54 dependent transcriptional regulator [Bryobacteraceae bacterium]
MAPPPVQTLDLLGLTAVIASPAMRSLLALTERAARSSAAVLITGESGAGKEIIARAVHSFSARASRPWVDVSCGAIPEHLVESELFGHERGAFSGAVAPKPGLFELAHTGTLFLDEIGELDLRLQVKLLRVLDGIPYYRLGGTKKVQVDVRIVAATNADLEKAVAEGRFRSDLFHRLSQVVLRVPPLRERVEDIGPLALHFLAGYRAQPRITREALGVLERYWWPGNVRELRNVLTRAALLADGAPIGPEHLGLPVEPRGVPAPVILHRLESLEKEAILRALRSTNGHREKAAALLGISRRTLSRKLRLYRELEGRGALETAFLPAPATENGGCIHERELPGKTA